MSESGPTVLSGRYELHRRLGRGGTSEIYLARDQLLDRPVAVKVLFQEFAADPSFVERFRREAQSAAGMNHPNIVGVYDWANEDGTYYLVLEYVEGRSLADIIRSGGALPAAQGAIIAADISSALSFAHRNGVVHRDIKPGNVMVSSDGHIKVTDFGIARAVSADTQNDLTQAGTVMGTATYFSPEQAQGHRVDHRSDLYSLGVSMYEMVAGKPPFSGDTPVSIAYKHVQEAPTPLVEVAPDVPASFAAIVMKLLEKDPADRYSSADELSDDIARFRDGELVQAAAAAGIAPEAPAPTEAADPTVAMRSGTQAGETPGAAANGAGVPGAAGVSAPSGVQGAAAAAGATVAAGAAQRQAAGAATTTMATAGGGGYPDYGPPPEAQPDPGGIDDYGAEPVDYEVDEGPEYVDAPRRASTGVFIAAIVALLAILAVLLSLLAQALSTDSGDGDPAEVEVPNVVDQPLERARTALEDNLGLVVRVEESVNEAVDPGTVFAQSPEAGFKVSEGATVDLKVATAAADLIVPDVVGLNRIEAERAFFANGISANLVNPRGVNSDEEIDVVLSQQPPARTRIGPEDQVSFTYSTGPEAQEIPDLAGRTPAEASNMLGRLGFTVTQEDEISDEEPGLVLRTEPAAGEDADPRETSITLIVARERPDVSVPNVVGRTEQRANDILIDRGYSIRATYQDLPPEDQRVGRVLQQTPGPDDIVEGGEQVLIVVGQAGDPANFTTTTTEDPNSTTSTDTTIDPNSTTSTDTTIDPNSTTSTDTTIDPNSTTSTIDPNSTTSTDTTTTTSSTTTTTTTTVVDPNGGA